jgi:hypothetical protein
MELGSTFHPNLLHASLCGVEESIVLCLTVPYPCIYSPQRLIFERVEVDIVSNHSAQLGSFGQFSGAVPRVRHPLPGDFIVRR